VAGKSNKATFSTLKLLVEGGGMATKTILDTGKYLLATATLFVSSVIAAKLVAMPEPNINDASSILLVFSLVLSLMFETAVMFAYVRSSALSGLKLILATFVLYFGIRTFMLQVETYVFMHVLTSLISLDLMAKIWLQGAISALIFSPVIATLAKSEEKPIIDDRQMAKTGRSLFYSLTLVAFLYTLIYFTAGIIIFVPLAGDASAEFYPDLQLPGWIIPFQLLRGYLWALLSLLLLSTSRLGATGRHLLAGLVFGVLVSAQLISPNDLMPNAIRLAHLVEMFVSMTLFGYLSALILGRKRLK
jgi:hypothetical protein